MSKRSSNSVIKDVPFSKKKSKGTRASHGKVDYHYQNYSNVMKFLKNNNFKDVCLFTNGFLHLDIDDIDSGIFLLTDEKYFKIELNKCIRGSDKFVPIILNLITKDENHANILLINKKTKKIELYEPHGSRTSSSTLGGVAGAYRKKVKVLKIFFNKFLPKYDVINSVDYQKGTAFQMDKDPENHSGFCVTWTILFIHYRILNPNIQLSRLIQYLAKKITTLKLLQYARYIEETLKK